MKHMGFRYQSRHDWRSVGRPVNVTQSKGVHDPIYCLCPS